MNVSLRKDGSRWIAYFPESRRVISVNQIGARILDLLFNRGMEIRQIVNAIASEYEVDHQRCQSDVSTFLADLSRDLSPDGFNIVEQEQLDAPLGVELEITTACNLRCRHCFQDRGNEGHMPTERVLEILKTLVDQGVFETSLIGGEPFKHPGIMEILKYCDQLDLATNLVTNGTLLEDSTIAQLTNFKRLVIIVSFDGMSDMHNRIRGPGIFESVDAILKKFVQAGVAVETTFTMNAWNIDEYQQTVEYCERLGIPCNFNLFKPFKPEHAELIPKPEAVFNVIIELLRLRRDRGARVGLANAAIVSELLGLPPRNECRATRSGMVIDVSGHMVTCPSLVAAGYYGDQELPAFNGQFRETWRTHGMFTSFRENGLRECQARSYIYSKDVRGFDPYGIEAFRTYWSERQRKSIV